MGQGAPGRYFSQLLPSTCWNSDAPKRMFCLSNIQATLVFKLLKSAPSTFQNGSELLWLPWIAQLPSLLCWAAGPWAGMTNLSGCNAFNPQGPRYALQRDVLMVLPHSWKLFSVIRAELYLRARNLTTPQDSLKGKALFYWLWYLTFRKRTRLYWRQKPLWRPMWQNEGFITNVYLHLL